jgi:hypothetical protein
MNETRQAAAFWPGTFMDWVELLIKLIVVIGALGAVYQYFDLKQENRVKETMAQLQAFNSGDLQAARLKLTAIWENYQPQFEAINRQTVASEQDKSLIQAKIVLPVIKQNKLQREIGLLVDFFDNLQVCVQHYICDREVAQGFFGGYAGNFHRLYRPWIEEQRKVIPGYAAHLQAFAQVAPKHGGQARGTP